MSIRQFESGARKKREKKLQKKKRTIGQIHTIYKDKPIFLNLCQNQQYHL
jgi:hypothetical protein